jgi:hypothetical protein
MWACPQSRIATGSLACNVGSCPGFGCWPGARDDLPWGAASKALNKSEPCFAPPRSYYRLCRGATKRCCIFSQPRATTKPESWANPQENIWQFMRENWLSNRIFESYQQIVDHCCHAWNKLIDQPWRIMSIGMREWAYQF